MLGQLTQCMWQQGDKNINYKLSDELHPLSAQVMTFDKSSFNILGGNV